MPKFYLVDEADPRAICEAQYPEIHHNPANLCYPHVQARDLAFWEAHPGRMLCSTTDLVYGDVAERDRAFWGEHPQEQLAPKSALVYLTKDERDTAYRQDNPPAAYQPSLFVPNMAAPLSEAEALNRIALLMPAADHRPGNAKALATYATPEQLTAFFAKGAWGGVGSEAEKWRRTLTGRTPLPMSTSTAMRYFAHMYGLGERRFMAMCWQESGHNWSALGDWWVWDPAQVGILYAADSPRRTVTVSGQPQDQAARSYQITQCMYRYHGSWAWPLFRDSAVMALGYTAAHLRSSANRLHRHLATRTPVSGYPTYDGATAEEAMLGAYGQWFSGGWYDSGAIDYLSKMQRWYDSQPWLMTGGVVAAIRSVVTRPEWDAEIAAFYGVAA